MKRLNIFQNRPKASKIDVAAYLNRIQLPVESPSVAYLKALQKAHLMHIPFENLDIHYRKKILLDYTKIFDKVIRNGRGGFCYELNGLFYHLLYHLGFDCYVISGEVRSKETEEFGKPFDHMIVVVLLDEQQWLVDVGFGDGPVSPLQIKEGQVQVDYTRYYRMDIDADERFVLKVSHDTNYYSSIYRFTTEEKQLVQFIEMCDYHQTSPDSPFTNKKLVTQLTEGGRVTLTDRQLKVVELGESFEMQILHEDEFLSKLEHHFGIPFQKLTGEA